MDELAGGVPAMFKFDGAEVDEQVDEQLPVRAHRAVLLLHLVKDMGGRHIGLAESGRTASGGIRCRRGLRS